MYYLHWEWSVVRRNLPFVQNQICRKFFEIKFFVEKTSFVFILTYVR